MTKDKYRRGIHLEKKTKMPDNRFFARRALLSKIKVNLMNLVRKCRKCGNWVYIIDKEIGDLVKCSRCGEDHHLSKTLSEKVVLTRI